MVWVDAEDEVVMSCTESAAVQSDMRAGCIVGIFMERKSEARRIQHTVLDWLEYLAAHGGCPAFSLLLPIWFQEGRRTIPQCDLQGGIEDAWP